MNRLLRVTIVAACAALMLPAIAQAQWWQHHPKYLHAMSNLRTAYWLIAHRDANDPEARPEERAAMKEISRAYQDLKDAAIVDQKDLADQPPANMNFWDHRARRIKTSCFVWGWPELRSSTLTREQRSPMSSSTDIAQPGSYRASSLIF